MSDARFEDAGERALRLRVETADDLTVISALLQDAVGQIGEISWAPRKRRLALLLNRFRWEDLPAAERTGREFERVRAVLAIDSALRVRSSGLDPREKETVVSILSLEFRPGEDGGGTVGLILAGDGEMEIDVECLDISLSDITRPYIAPSGKAPEHGS